MSQARYELIGAAISPFVRKVRVVMAVKQIAYDLTPLNIFAPPEGFEAISPLKRIPVLRDRGRGDETLADSSVIVAYLEAQHQDCPVFPEDAWDRARALWIEEYMDTEFAFRMGMGVFRPRVVYPRLGKQADEGLVEKTLTEHAPRLYGYLESQIAGKDWFVGGSMTIADIAVATQFANMRHAQEAPDHVVYPHLSAHVAKMLALPVFEAMAAQERG